MRIGFVAHGVSLHTQRWCGLLISQGHDVHLFSFQNPGIDGLNFHELISISEINSLVKYLSAVPSLKRMLKEVAPDIVIGYYITSNGVMAALAGAKPLVVSGAGSDVLVDPTRSAARRFLLKYALNKAGIIHCRTEHMKRAITALGIPENKILTVPSGIRPEAFPLSQKPPVGERPPVVISTRLLDKLYHTDNLVRAMKIVFDTRPECECRIAGRGTEEEDVKRTARELGLEKKIEFPGWLPVEAMAEFLGSGDVYVSLTTSDGSSSSLFEALAVGLYPVLSDIPPNREWVEDGVNGLLVPWDDPEKIAEGILHAIDIVSESNEVLIKNRKLIEEKANHERNFNRITEEMKKLCGK